MSASNSRSREQRRLNCWSKPTKSVPEIFRLTRLTGHSVSDSRPTLALYFRFRFFVVRMSVSEQSPSPTPADTPKWVPAKSYRHFVAGGYVLLLLFFCTLENASIQHFASFLQTRWYVRSHSDCAFWRCEDTSTVWPFPRKTYQLRCSWCVWRWSRFGCPNAEKTWRTSLQFCRNRSYSSVSPSYACYGHILFF